MEKYKKDLCIEEMDKAQLKMGEQISKELQGSDVYCANLATNKPRSFNIPVHLENDEYKIISINFEENMTAGEYAQILEQTIMNNFKKEFYQNKDNTEEM